MRLSDLPVFFLYLEYILLYNYHWWLSPPRLIHRALMAKEVVRNMLQVLGQRWGQREALERCWGPREALGSRWGPLEALGWHWGQWEILGQHWGQREVQGPPGQPGLCPS